MVQRDKGRSQRRQCRMRSLRKPGPLSPEAEWVGPTGGVFLEQPNGVVKRTDLREAPGPTMQSVTLFMTVGEALLMAVKRWLDAMRLFAFHQTFGAMKNVYLSQ